MVSRSERSDGFARNGRQEEVLLRAFRSGLSQGARESLRLQGLILISCSNGGAKADTEVTLWSDMKKA